MTVEIMKTSSKRKSLKARRVKGHQRLFVDINNPIAPDPDSITMNRIIGNIKKIIKEENENKRN